MVFRAAVSFPGYPDQFFVITFSLARLPSVKSFLLKDAATFSLLFQGILHNHSPMSGGKGIEKWGPGMAPLNINCRER